MANQQMRTIQMLTRSTQTLLAIGAAVTLACAPTAQTTTANGDTARVTTDADPDVRPAGATGLPAGYQGRTDRPAQQLADARYTPLPNGWEVTTGPSHILWSNDHTASGNYTVSATFEQLQRPAHPEAFGIFIGGRDLDADGQAYTYFLVRGTGEAFAQRRDGANLTRLQAWTPSAAVPAADEAGRQTYRLEVRVAADSVRFFVNGAQAVAVARAAVQTDGLAGLRINHNLNVRVTPIQITRQ
jgi:hypothetical protein